ncbi:hypothetical protein [uncultured Sphingomonas sp.]|uniref:hypothetical protein n=1 Tax=uncultured Sphingomonas sp. TaxID=158754 RepID=UPI0025D81799|nr:hypothetical protein [uncultured Sphingomonas sp.]
MTESFARVTNQALEGRYVSPPISMSRAVAFAPPSGEMATSQLVAATSERPAFARVSESNVGEQRSVAATYEKPAVGSPSAPLWSTAAVSGTSLRYVTRQLEDAEPPLLKQANGDRITGDDIHNIIRGIVSPGDQTAAGTFLRSLWLDADGPQGATWTGLQAAAFLATGDYTTACRLGSPIEVVGSRGREILSSTVVAHCLRWTVASHIPRDKMDAVGATGCVDTAFMRLNQAMHRGDIFARSGAGPVNWDNGRHVVFATDQVMALLPDAKRLMAERAA